jgi:hypothetical protein
MTHDATIKGSSSHFSLPTLNVQADLVEKHKGETLLFCPHLWALRHVFTNQDTSEVVHARCTRWDCLYCGPRKMDQWRQLVKAAEPTLFITPLDTDEAPEGGNGKPLEEEKIVKRSSWSLVKCEECTDDIQEYRCWRRKAL